MTKEQFCAKWEFSSYWKADLEAVIAHEIAKAQEPQPENLKGNCSTFDMSRLVDQPQPAKPFDKERFERMFRAVYQSTTSNFDKCIEYTKENLNKLDAYYVTKEGGNNE